ncbi:MULTISPECIES: P1 family peptidase [unclassified Haematobacter]|uniref:DmpA family aminopeptidase n=1 Tax=unclassified Haematobacter TaxID=2640585 RepID=UPI0025B8B04B|nr:MULTISPECIES: P1 family peptidase [unclassified Haematobacter]
MLIRDFGIVPGILPPGPLNAITDVAGVMVGHRTIRHGQINTGVTAVVPHPGDMFRQKLRTGVAVINGFGKSAGLVQVEELGTLESPVLLTNTFAVGACTTALIRRALAADPAIGRETSTVNAVVCECNDGVLSDIRALAVTEADAEAALDAAQSGPVEQGSVGCGTGMTAFGFKGGTGTSSRVMEVGGERFTLGALVQANFGNAGDLVLPDGRRPRPEGMIPATPERGSVIILLATDLPLESRQLTRIARRAGAGLARLGSFWGNGSGDIALAFTTADPVPHDGSAFLSPRVLAEEQIDLAFRAAAEATEEAVLNALTAAEPLVGRDGAWLPSLGQWLADQGRGADLR